MNANEIYLGNWGTVIFQNEQHKNYLILAKNLRDIQSSIASWHGEWLSNEMEKNFLKSEAEAKAKCDKLWELIPDKDNLSKSH